MDILIMVLLLVLAVLIYRGARRGLVLVLWFVAFVAVLALFRYHVTSSLDLELLMSGEHPTEALVFEDPEYTRAMGVDTAVMSAVPTPSATPQADRPRPWLGKIIYWGVVGWILAYSGTLAGAFVVQFAQGEFPCPLCMLQRYMMILSSLGAMWIVMQARRGTLTMGRYGQGLGLGLLAALGGAVISARQILLHIKPGDPGYGSAVLGMHLYTWALITFFIVALFCAVALILMPKVVATAPGTSFLGRLGRIVTTVVLWIFLILVAANVLAIIFLEGVAWVLPDDPTSYNLLDQIGLGNG